MKNDYSSFCPTKVQYYTSSTHPSLSFYLPWALLKLISWLHLPLPSILPPQPMCVISPSLVPCRIGCGALPSPTRMVPRSWSPQAVPVVTAAASHGTQAIRQSAGSMCLRTWPRETSSALATDKVRQKMPFCMISLRLVVCLSLSTTGFLCGSCVNGTGVTSLLNRCEACDTANVTLIVFLGNFAHGRHCHYIYIYIYMPMECPLHACNA